MTKLPSSLREAKALGSKWYFTGKPCKNGHVAKRYTISCGTCAECFPAIQAKHRAKNRERRAEYNKAWGTANPDKNAAKSKRWRDRHPGKANLLARTRYHADKDRHRALIRERHAIRRRATPRWLSMADRADISTIYRAAVILQRVSLTPHHVDHIQPLSGKDRCGLHVPWNLQIITATENISKFNRPPEI